MDAAAGDCVAAARPRQAGRAARILWPCPTMEVAGMSDAPASVLLLGRDDVAPMRAMLAMFGEAFDEGRAYSDRPPGAAWLQRLLGSDAFIAIAAMKDAAVVGGV